MIYITRRERFNAAHRLWNAEWSDEKNREVFGLCSNIHGHNWELVVTVKGEIDPNTGFVMDLKDLSKVMKSEVTDKVDHTFLNEDVPFLKGKYPTTEIFAVEIWKILAPVLQEKYNTTLHCVKLIETPNHYVEYFGD
ncbi:6-carboxytetrahydropterin synthase [Emticicia sp. TH156]|uniref:6-pyruvoyl trahydropterin synthase family protein n=1 Tax=Emticicia sp. TH156 TaxID=2067454 RepID=UPI000C76E5BF|nr:6-carboxytetrahydropterin synthase [Emticicia sp. TH156]PLK43741.1 6-pyruvoyl tetrahydrobiopterin synthase [Emticicia sp. TH156]